MAETDRSRVVVTGGAGFIGSHLCERLLADGRAVTVLDDLSTGDIANLRAVEGDPRLRIIVGSTTDAALVDEVCREARTVFHLAAVVGVKKVMEDPATTIEKNFLSSQTVLQACNRYRLRLLVTSSSEVYGANPKPAFREDDDSIIGSSKHRRWCYAAGKLLDEFHALAYVHATALPVTVVRLFNTVGPRQVGRYGMVVPRFVRQALAGEPITVHGDGTQRRCFTHVRDVVRCLLALADCGAAHGEVVNIGSTEEIAIQDLAARIRERTGSASPIRKLSYGEVYGEDFVDMERRVPDVSRLRSLIGYAPDTPLDAILGDVIGWARETQG